MHSWTVLTFTHAGVAVINVKNCRIIHQNDMLWAALCVSLENKRGGGSNNSPRYKKFHEPVFVDGIALSGSGYL